MPSLPRRPSERRRTGWLAAALGLLALLATSCGIVGGEDETAVPGDADGTSPELVAMTEDPLCDAVDALLTAATSGNADADNERLFRSLHLALPLELADEVAKAEAGAQRNELLNTYQNADDHTVSACGWPVYRAYFHTTANCLDLGSGSGAGICRDPRDGSPSELRSLIDAADALAARGTVTVELGESIEDIEPEVDAEGALGGTPDTDGPEAEDTQGAVPDSDEPSEQQLPEAQTSEDQTPEDQASEDDEVPVFTFPDITTPTLADSDAEAGTATDADAGTNADADTGFVFPDITPTPDEPTADTQGDAAVPEDLAFAEDATEDRATNGQAAPFVLQLGTDEDEDADTNEGGIDLSTIDLTETNLAN